MSLFDLPRLFDSKFSNTTMVKAAASRVRAVNQRYAPDIVVIYIYADAEARMIGTIFVYVARCE